MPIPILPLFSDDMTIINNHIAVHQHGDVVYWYKGTLPVFRHHVRDHKSFRLFCCQLINIGTATAAEISKALHVNREKLSRWARIERDSSNHEGQTESVTAKKSTCLNPRNDRMDRRPLCRESYNNRFQQPRHQTKRHQPF